MRLWALIATCAATMACGKGSAAPPSSTGTLSSEVIDTVAVTLTPGSNASFDVTMLFSNAYGLFDSTTPIKASGHIDAYPEADLIDFTAKIASPPVAGGPCAGAPVSLALSLVRRGTNAHVGGGLAAYCGASTYSGAPQRILRLQGDLPL